MSEEEGLTPTFLSGLSARPQDTQTAPREGVINMSSSLSGLRGQPPSPG